MVARTELAAFGGTPAIQSAIVHDWPLVADEDIKAVNDSCVGKRWSYYSSEQEISALESKVRARLDRSFAIALNSGTSALHVAFLTLGLVPGDEVLVPTYTFPSTVTPLVHSRSSMVFYDTARESPVPSVKEIERRISSRTRAIVVSHMDGYSAPMDDIVQLAQRHGLCVVEDVAQALGASTQGNQAGSKADLAAFSFTEKKIAVGGEGGMLVTSRRDLYERAILFSYLQKRSFTDVVDPQLRQFAYTGLGFNLRMHPFAAALANSQMDRVDSHIAARTKAWEMVRGALQGAPGIRFPTPPTTPDSLGGYSIKLLLDKTIDRVTYVQLLAAEGVPIVCSETKPLHRCPLFDGGKRYSGLGLEVSVDVGRPLELENAEHYADCTIRMPPITGVNEETLQCLSAAFSKVGEFLSGGNLQIQQEQR